MAISRKGGGAFLADAVSSALPSVPVQPESSEQQSVVSDRSIEIFHSTLFDSFDLKAAATYNYYTADELNDFATVDADGVLSRFITLTWRPAPRPIVTYELSSKTRTAGVGSKTAAVTSIVRAGTTYSVDADRVGLANDMLANGFISPGVANATMEDPVVSMRTVRPALEDTLSSGVASPPLSHITSNMTASRPALSPIRRNVRFADPGIATNALSDARVAAATTAHQLTALATVATVAVNIETISATNQSTKVVKRPPTVRSPEEFVGVSYIGYVIEKYEDTIDDGLVLIDTIPVDGAHVTSFVDDEVLYGRRYAYRIRSVVRWTRRNDTGFFGLDTTQQVSDMSQVSNVLSMQSSFYGADWSNWSYSDVVDTEAPPPPEELFLRPWLDRRVTQLCWKIPDDHQHDIIRFVVVRKVGIDGSWEEVFECERRNGVFWDQLPVDRGSDLEIIYAMYSVSIHDERSVLSEQLACRVDGSTTRVRMVSGPGASIDGHGAFAVYPPTVIHPTLESKRSLSVSVRSGQSMIPLFTKDIVIRIESLVNGETVDSTVRLDSSDISTGSVSLGLSPRRTVKG